ncbi:hypothetical protein CSUI_010836 [Cystoisospora suis]|uniref:Uncharacterized protein n=1 Tax=Cystoisospora suis TaxID=483139 RepID=A0A2C6KG51_9APIC|nr:hypothetical protein CSUI_010836 [Cystoisospora suis]
MSLVDLLLRTESPEEKMSHVERNDRRQYLHLHSSLEYSRNTSAESLERRRAVSMMCPKVFSF